MTATTAIFASHGWRCRALQVRVLWRQNECVTAKLKLSLRNSVYSQIQVYVLDDLALVILKFHFTEEYFHLHSCSKNWSYWWQAPLLLSATTQSPRSPDAGCSPRSDASFSSHFSPLLSLCLSPSFHLLAMMWGWSLCLISAILITIRITWTEQIIGRSLANSSGALKPFIPSELEWGLRSYLF